MSSIAEQLRSIYLFKDFSDKEIGLIEEISTLKGYGASGRIFEQGDEAQVIYLVVSGVVKIIKAESGGVVATIEAGETFGEMPFLDGGNRSATAIAVEDLDKTELIRIPYSKLATTLLNNPEMALRFYIVFAKYISKRLRTTTENLDQAREEAYKHF